MSTPMHIAFPLAIGRDGRLATASDTAHITGLIEQLIFTNPGERVNRPAFGGALNQLLFAPNSIELRATVNFTLLAALQHELGDLIEVTSLDVDVAQETLAITIAYRVLRTGQQVSATMAGIGP
jgi:phage baseplate assembly protein W